MSDITVTASGQAAQKYGQTAAEEDTTPPAAGEEEAKSLHEMIQEAKEKADAQRERFKLKNTIRYGDAPIEAYARLARARTAAEVSSASGYAQRQIMRFKAAMRQDSDNAESIKAAINQLQKAVSRAGKKKMDLNREKLNKLRQKRAMERERRAEAQRLKQELRRAQSARLIRESGYIREAEIDSRMQAQMAATRMELRAQAQELAQSFSSVSEAAIQQYASAVPEASVSVPSVSIEA